MMPALFPSKRLASTWILFAAVALGVGCGPAWTVVKQANPNPMSPQKSFAVEPVRFESLKVGEKTEQQYLADKSTKDPQFEAKWKGDLAAIDQMFSAEVIKGEDPDITKLGYRAAFELVPQIPRGNLVEVRTPTFHGDLLVLNLRAAEGKPWPKNLRPKA